MDLDDFQARIAELYGPGDARLGLGGSVAWLAEETGEFARAARKGTRAEQLHELGDVLAWLASIATQLGLSLDEAAERYRTDPPPPAAG